MKKHESNDFLLLSQCAALIQKAAAALEDGLRTSFAEHTNPDRLRTEARALYQTALARLEHEFVPPMERRDLALLAERLFALASSLSVAEATMCATPYSAFSEGFAAIGALLSACGSALETLIGTLPQLPRSPQLQPQLAELLDRTRKADDACIREIGALSTSGASAGLLIARYAALSRLRAAAQAFAAAAEAVAAAAVNNG